MADCSAILQDAEDQMQEENEKKISLFFQAALTLPDRWNSTFAKDPEKSDRRRIQPVYC